MKMAVEIIGLSRAVEVVSGGGARRAEGGVMDGDLREQPAPARREGGRPGTKPGEEQRQQEPRSPAHKAGRRAPEADHRTHGFERDLVTVPNGSNRRDGDI